VLVNNARAAWGAPVDEFPGAGPYLTGAVIPVDGGIVGGAR